MESRIKQKVKDKTLKNRQDKIQDVEFCNDFLDLIPKVQLTKDKKNWT